MSFLLEFPFVADWPLLTMLRVGNSYGVCQFFCCRLEKVFITTTQLTHFSFGKGFLVEDILVAIAHQ